MSKYVPTIGLEIHAELSTKTKMFCGSKNNPDEKKPNVNICPVCMAHPGTLPVVNKEAVKYVLRVGTALGGQIAGFTEFDRKNYFYPDIPKAYQISQYKYPLVTGGSLLGVDITRIHLEEDTARSQHSSSGSLVDFNRAGVPLMELVTEPVITSATEAGDFARELQLLLSPEYLNVSEANMEKGELRVEANISVSDNPNKFGTKVEVKNLNSFRAVEKAILFEIERQIDVLTAGGQITQETRGWDENKGVTFSQRKKETSEDYRYFPDPDLPKFYINEIPEWQNLAHTLPELPAQKRQRFNQDYGLKKEDIETFVKNYKLAQFFEQVATNFTDIKAWQVVANFITSDSLGVMTKENLALTENLLGNLSVEALTELVQMYTAGEVSSRGAKDILHTLLISGGEARGVATAKNLFQKSDAGELQTIIDEVIAENESVVADFKAGNDKPLQFLIGQAMKKSKGAANPTMLAKLLVEKLQ
ncbi:MAG: Asp-tRNA(Asn)/Glu-tRNA(Gln) amidotransferase subunit GatB [Candidatus Paceibacterota bacterium]